MNTLKTRSIGLSLIRTAAFPALLFSVFTRLPLSNDGGAFGPSAAFAGPTREQVAEKNRKFLASGETEKKIAQLKDAKSSAHTEEEMSVDDATNEMLVEFTTLFIDIKALSAQMSSPEFNDPSKITQVSDIDWRLGALDRAIEINTTSLTEKYWETKFRTKLQATQASPKKQAEVLAAFMRGIHTGLDNRMKQLGLSSTEQAESFKAAEQKRLETTKELFGILKTEWGKWKAVDGKVQFENAEAGRRFDALNESLNEKASLPAAAAQATGDVRN